MDGLLPFDISACDFFWSSNSFSLTVSIGSSTSPYLAAEYFGIAHVYVAESPIGFVAQTCPSAAALEYFAFPTLFVPIAEDSDPAATVTAPAIVTVTVTVS